MLNPIFYGVSLKSYWQNTHGEQDIEKSLGEPCAKVRQPVPKLYNKQITK